ncbi:MAG: ABC transporter permease subunit [Bacilli bacterium]|nr:ABC transporter permease subunit [Bacilli bacterium]
MNSTIKKYSLGIISIVSIFLLWQVIVIIKNDAFIFPGVLEILKSSFKIITNKSDLIVLSNTLFKLIIVIIISLLLAGIVAFIYIIFPSSIYFFRPIINILKAAPFAVISIYIFYAFYQTKEIAPGIVTFLVVLPLSFEGLIGAIDNIDKNLIDDMKMLEISTFKKFIYVYIPICVPFIVTTLLQSFGLGLKVMIMSEFMSQVDKTIGGALFNIKYNYDYAYLLGWLVIIITIVSIIDMLIRIISKRSKILSIKK